MEIKMDKKILLDAIEKSGFILEQKTYNELLKNHFTKTDVKLNSIVQLIDDSHNSQQLHEMDVLAERSYQSSSYVNMNDVFIIECKSHIVDSCIVLRESKSKNEKYPNFGMISKKRSCDFSIIEEYIAKNMLNHKINFYDSADFFEFTKDNKCKKSGKQNDKCNLHKGMKKLTVLTQAYFENTYYSHTHSSADSYTSIFPILVTDRKMYAYKTGNELKGEIEEISYGALLNSIQFLSTGTTRASNIHKNMHALNMNYNNSYKEYFTQKRLPLIWICHVDSINSLINFLRNERIPAV